MHLNIILMKLNISISLTVTQEIMAILLQQTLTRKSIFAKFPQTEDTGKTAIGLKQNQWKSNAFMTSLKLARKTCIYYIMRNLNLLPKTSQELNVFVSL